MSKKEKGLAEIDSQSKKVVIKLLREKAVVIKVVDGVQKKVEETSPDGQSTYVRNDVLSLQNLLSKFNTTKHPQREWYPWAMVKEKMYNCYANQKSEVELTLGEASFLKVFLEELPTNEGKTMALRDTEVRTRQAILDQLYLIELKKRD